MGLRLDDKWVWDFWFAQDGADYHIFYLQADRALKDQHLRHWNVSIGHAISQDLVNWRVLPDALKPTPYDGTGDEPFDSKTTWTGSIIKHNGLWYLFYTGSKQSEDGLIQRVCLATSNDLMTWEKHAHNPIMEADPQWYELLDRTMWHDQAWRDPYVFQHPETGEFHAFITARINTGAADARGVIGHAKSSDLLHWEILPPLAGTGPGEFGHLEVPQIVHINDLYYLLFACPEREYSHARRERVGEALRVGGTHYMVSESPLGPYRYLTDEYLVGDKAETLYSGKLIQAPNGTWQFMAFKNFTEAGDFVGELADPFPVTVLDDGRLQVNTS